MRVSVGIIRSGITSTCWKR